MQDGPPHAEKDCSACPGGNSGREKKWKEGEGKGDGRKQRSEKKIHPQVEASSRYGSICLFHAIF